MASQCPQPPPTEPQGSASAQRATSGHWRRAAGLLRGVAGDKARIVVACSGGIDSQVLLHWSARWARRLGFVHLGAVGIDHGLRREAPDELALARQLATSLGLGFVCRWLRLKTGSRLAERARTARFAGLQAAANEIGADVILLGHTRDDQAETVLWHLLRGTGLRGAGGIRVRRGPFLRPLLPLSRRDMQRYAQVHGLRWAEDPTNHALQHARAWLRHRVLPSMQRLQPRAAEHLAAFARQAQQDDAYLVRVASRQLAACRRDHHGRLALDLVRWQTLPTAIAQRVLLAWLGLLPTTPDRRTVERLMRALRPREAKPLATGAVAGALLSREGSWLVGCPASQAPPRRTAKRPAKALIGSTSLPFATPMRCGQHVLQAKRLTVPDGEDPWSWLEAQNDPQSGIQAVAFAGNRLHVGLSFRPWCIGDRLRAFGAPGRVKVSDLLNRARVPRHWRDGWPVVICGDTIVWVVGVRRGEMAPVLPTSRHLVVLEARFAPADTVDAQVGALPSFV